MPGTFFTPISGDSLKAGDILLKPAYNPAVLETCLWNENNVLRCIEDNHVSFKNSLGRVLKSESREGEPPSERIEEGPFMIYPASIFCKQKTVFGLIQFKDGQIALLAISGPGQKSFIEHFSGLNVFFKRQYNLTEKAKRSVYLVKSDLKTIKCFLSQIAPETAPRALGAVPKLGIGNRTTTLAWPGIFEALQKGSILANAIQNSVGRELAPLATLINSKRKEYTYLPGLGRVQVGHTGSSIRGLWLYGVLSAMMAGHRIPYGADADHIPVRKERGKIRLNYAKKLIRQSKDYTFFTLDTSDLFTYPNLDVSYSKPNNRQLFNHGYAKKFIFKNPGKGRDFHYCFSPDELKRYQSKYGPSLNAAGELYQYIQTLKGEAEFDFEFSMDEFPDKVPVSEAVTSAKELIFVVNELRFRGVNVNHVAPNFGIEKGFDYRLFDGLNGLMERIVEMSAIAKEMGILLDFHSGDDLSRKTYQTIAEATGGMLQLKISPRLQMIFAETLFDADRKLFNKWWNWTLIYAQKEAREGSATAKRLMLKLEKKVKINPSPSPRDDFFHYYSFAIVGLKDKKGYYCFREKFYKVEEGIKKEYGKRITTYILNLAKTLMIS